MNIKVFRRVLLAFIALYLVIFVARAVYDLTTFKEPNISSSVYYYQPFFNYVSERLFIVEHASTTTEIEQQYEQVANIVAKTDKYDSDIKRLDALLEELRCPLSLVQKVS
ncbi:MAG: hypothetical protein FWH42_05435 [Dehalococcoidia bacterium]|nr:hypothetical protein [Dehalococcoidia bacterium]